MSRTFIQFCRVQDALPRLSAATAINYKSLGKIDFLTHTGPDLEEWALLWVDVEKLAQWAYFRNLEFSENLKAAIQRFAVSTTQKMGGQD